ncbi:hypothetical protein [Tardiphaga sp.]|uniref:hypothetical protein n=1 Tax=Tardiphaga sp. TaxID=1926292 RepID=UPI002635E5D9|nr:hypothetical protein [Tardiphaga sp.]MDB5618452.1 hypothetical protein [Tardiphaga sp.]
MAYRIGDVEIQGEQSTNVIELAFRRKTRDGGKARILRRRAMRMKIDAEPQRDICDDLAMHHVDTGDTSPCDMA